MWQNRQTSFKIAMFTNLQLSAARWVFSDALETSAGNVVLIVHDEVTAGTAECLRVAATSRDIGAEVEVVHVPFDRQAAFSKIAYKALDPALRTKIDEADRVVMLQKTAPEVSFFRLAVLEYCIQIKRGCRAASMPGVTLDVLGLCLGDLKVVTRRCDLVADLMVRSRVARLITTQLDGTTLELRLPLSGGWPVKSTGRIRSNDWGNVPSGETFVVPAEYAAQGKVVINGSVLYYPLPDDEELVLDIQDGVVRFPFHAIGGVRREATRLLFDESGREIYDRCTTLCELGIGTNGDITRFTGLQLFDEKILGTVHLGFGRNKQFGGSIDSPVHNDFVIKAPTLFLDDVLVTEGGRFVLADQVVYPNWRNVPSEGLGDAQFIRVGPEHAERDDTGVFLSWVSPRGQSTQRTRIGDQETCLTGADLLTAIEREQGGMSVGELVDRMKSKYDAAAVRSTVALLKSFRLVEV